MWLVSERGGGESSITLSKCLFQVIIEQVREELDNVAGVTEVHGRYYDLASQYYQVWWMRAVSPCHSSLPPGEGGPCSVLS